METMNNNEETQIMNQQEETQTLGQTTEQPLENTSETQQRGSNVAGRVAAAAVLGSVAGAASAIGAETIYNNLTEDNSDNEEDEDVIDDQNEDDIVVDEEEVLPTDTDDTDIITEDDQPITYEEQPESQTPVHYTPTAHAQQTVNEIPHEVHATTTVIEEPATTGSEEQGGVQVMGISTNQNEDGTYSTYIGVQAADGDRAILADIDTDGIIDGIITDDNGDGQISEDEVHDIHDQGWQTGDYMVAYAQQGGVIGVSSSNEAEANVTVQEEDATMDGVYETAYTEDGGDGTGIDGDYIIDESYDTTCDSSIDESSDCEMVDF